VFILGIKFEINKHMTLSLPSFDELVRSEEIMSTLEESYAVIAPIWVPLQVQWMNGIYSTFKDHEKFMIIAHLISKSFQFYSQNFIRLTFDEYFSQNQIEIEKYNIMDIAKNLSIPKETARRKTKELESIGYIKRRSKKIIIDRSTWPDIQPIYTVKRLSRFFSTLSKTLHQKKILKETISSEDLTKTIKENFSYVWKLYYDMQIPMLLNQKKLHSDLESFHVWGVCLVNQFIDSKKKIGSSHLSKEYYLDEFIFSQKRSQSGVNAMSISDITGIPRATVIRKLKKLVKNNFLKIDSKKHYYTTGHYQKILLNMQKKNFLNLSKFAASIYNLNIHQRIN